MKKISVYHFNTNLHGGAAIAAQRLFNSLEVYKDLNIRFYNKHFFDGDKYFKYQNIEYPSIVEKLVNKTSLSGDLKYKVLKNFDKYTKGRPNGLEPFDPPYRYKTNVPQPLPDIVHLHWISDFIDYPSFFKSIPDHIPIVWTLHDMNPFTGGCHYSNGCSKYKLTGCERCPQLGPQSEFDLAKYCFEVKQNAFVKDNLHIVADSEWLKKEAFQSVLFKNAKSVQCIHYGVDTTIFLPRDKLSCRHVLNLEHNADEFILCFGAEYVNNKRKGFQVLAAALNILKDQGVKITCLVFGNGNFESFDNIEVIQFGQVNVLNYLNTIYNAADLFIIPSLEEAFGQTCLEAMSCGVPVVGFNTGGIPDMIVDGETGMLAKTGDPNDLAIKIELLLSNKDLREKMSANCRQKVLSEFTLNTQAANYYNLYKSTLL